MKQGRAHSLSQRLTWLALAAGLGLGAAHAQEHADIAELLQAGRLGEAQARVDRQLASKPRDPQLRLYKGVIQRESGRAAEAIQTFTRLSEDHPELPEPHNNLAVIYAAQGQYDKARIALEKALRTHPSYATAHENLSDVYARLASQAYSKALQIEGAAPPTAGTRLALIRELSPAATGRATRPSATTAVLASAPVVPSPAPVPSVAPAPASSKPPIVAAAPAKPPVVIASAPAAPVAPAPFPAGPALRPETQREVEQAVRAWARAWADKDMPQYLAAYDPAFETPGRQSRSAWEQDRRLRITGKTRITVELLDLQITVQGTRAVAKFRQDYKADALAVLSRKTLELSKAGERWLIVKETSGG